MLGAIIKGILREGQIYIVINILALGFFFCLKSSSLFSTAKAAPAFLAAPPPPPLPSASSAVDSDSPPPTSSFAAALAQVKLRQRAGSEAASVAPKDETQGRQRAGTDVNRPKNPLNEGILNAKLKSRDFSKRPSMYRNGYVTFYEEHV